MFCQIWDDDSKDSDGGEVPKAKIAETTLSIAIMKRDDFALLIVIGAHMCQSVPTSGGNVDWKDNDNDQVMTACHPPNPEAQPSFW